MQTATFKVEICMQIIVTKLEFSGESCKASAATIFRRQNFSKPHEIGLYTDAKLIKTLIDW